MSVYEILGYLNNYGFCVKKNKIDKTILGVLEKYFSVKPELNYENEKIKDEDKYFSVFYQDEKYIVLPKFSTNITINLSKYAKSKDDEEKKTISIDENEYSKIRFKINKYKYSNQLSKFEFNGKLRDYQQVIINEIFSKFGLDPNKPTIHDKSQTYPKGGLIKLSCGGGKCLGFNTPVMMADGTVKMVQDIIVGDKLMGDDSKPREVLSLARGREQMYRVIQENGEPYIVNSSHILSLCNLKANKFIDMGVHDYLKLSTDEKNNLFGYKIAVKFNLKPISINSYTLGILLGNFIINNNIHKNNKYHINNLETRISSSSNNFKYNIFDIVNTLRLNPSIPLEYKANNYTIQLNLLIGILNSLNINDNNILINTSYINLHNDLKFILNSLGIEYIFSSVKNTSNDENIYTIKITDKFIINNISNLLDKMETFKMQRVLLNKIKLEPLGEDNYYGFEIDGNRRFLLGDFTVTHNTMLAIYLSWALGLKTLVVTHKEFLMDQWEERIAQFTTAKVGRIRQSVVDVEDKDIVIGMLRSLSIKDYPTDILQQFGLVIYDEVHHTGSRVDSQALLKTSAQYTLGLSATPDRADGMTKVINWHIGNILYEMEKKYNYRVLVKKVFFRSSDSLFKEKKRWFPPKNALAPNHTSMTENLTKIKTRNQLIVSMINTLKGMGRKILVLSYRVEHLEFLKQMVDEKIKADGETHIYNSYFYMGKTKRGEKKLAEKDGHIIFATMQLAEEGLDISHLDTVIFALPVSIQKDKKKKGKIKSSKALIQSIGRILRNDKLEDLTQIPLVIDLSDMFSIYSSWSDKRNEVYGKKNWYIQNYYWEDLELLNSSNININKNKPNGEKKKYMNLMFDDITDEDFIEKNLMITEEVAKEMTIQDKQDEQDELEISSETSDKQIKSNKIKQIKQADEDDEVKPIVYGFGKKKT